MSCVRARARLCDAPRYVVGSSAATAAGLRDGFLTKLANGTGEVLWTVPMASAGDDFAEAVAYSPGSSRQPNGVVVVGSFSASMTLGTGTRARTITVPVNRQCGWHCCGMFIARYNTDSRLLWAVSATGLMNDLVRNACRNGWCLPHSSD